MCDLSSGFEKNLCGFCLGKNCLRYNIYYIYSIVGASVRGLCFNKQVTLLMSENHPQTLLAACPAKILTKFLHEPSL